MIGFAAGVDPACAIHGAVGVSTTHGLVGGIVLAGIAGAECLPVVAGGIGDVAVHRRFCWELVLSAVGETGYRSVSTFGLPVVTQDHKAKDLTEGTIARQVCPLETERRGTAVVGSRIISVNRHWGVGRRDSVVR